MQSLKSPSGYPMAQAAEVCLSQSPVDSNSAQCLYSQDAVLLSPDTDLNHCQHSPPLTEAPHTPLSAPPTAHCRIPHSTVNTAHCSLPHPTLQHSTPVVDYAMFDKATSPCPLTWSIRTRTGFKYLVHASNLSPSPRDD